MVSNKDFIINGMKESGIMYNYPFYRVNSKEIDMDVNSETFQEYIEPEDTNNGYEPLVSIQYPNSEKNKGLIEEFTQQGITLDCVLLVTSIDEIKINDEFTFDDKPFHIVKVAKPAIGNNDLLPSIVFYDCIAVIKKNQSL